MMKAYSAKDLWAYEDMLYTLQSALNTAKVYEVFTKDEVIAMLTEIKTEICEHWDNDPSYIEGVHDSEMVVQQKIDKLKENTQCKYAPIVNME